MKRTKFKWLGNQTCSLRAVISAANHASMELLEERQFLTAAAPVGAQFVVNAFHQTDQHDPAIASDAAGDFVVAWTSAQQDGSGDGVYARLYNAAGTPRTNEFLVGSVTAGDQNDPVVAMDDAGDFAIAFQSGGQGGLQVRRFSAAGAPLGPEVSLDFVIEQSIAMDG